MAHDANDVLGSLKIRCGGEDAARAAIVEQVARYKGRLTETAPGTELELQDRDLVIRGFWPAIEYLEETYPFPPIFPDSSPRRAMVRSLTAQLLREPQLTLAALWAGMSRGEPTRFIFSDDAPWLLDFAVAVVGAGSEKWAQHRESVETSILNAADGISVENRGRNARGARHEYERKTPA